MSSQPSSPDLADYAELAEQMFELACDLSTQTLVPVGVVLAGVISHLAIEAQIADVPEELLHGVISSAGKAHQKFEREPVKFGVSQ